MCDAVSRAMNMFTDVFIHVSLHFIAFIVAMISLTVADENEHRLIRDLMKSYDRRVRPSHIFNQTTNVTFGVALSQIIDVDEKNQILTTNIWINQGWMDTMLSWNPQKYGGIEVIRLPYKEIWIPDILLYNNADVDSRLSAVSTNVIVDQVGNVTWLSMVIYKSSCKIDVRYFPFDEQNCTLQFASWTFDGPQMNLIKLGEEGDISNYIVNSEWHLQALVVTRRVQYFSCCKDPYIFIDTSIIMRRRPLFYLFNMVMPCILITQVALLGFCMPSDSGEKISMGITTLLSITVFLMIVAESMPPTSDVLPLIGVYYGVTIVIVSSATAMTVFTLNIYHNGSRGYEVPPLLRRITFGVIAKIFCVRIDIPGVTPGEHMKYNSKHERYEGCESRRPENGTISPRFQRRAGGAAGPTPLLSQPSCSSGSSETHYEKQFMRVMNKVYQTIQGNEIRLAEQDRREAIKHEWQQLAVVFDRLLLWCFMFITITVTLTVMLKGPHTQLGGNYSIIAT